MNSISYSDKDQRQIINTRGIFEISAAIATVKNYKGGNNDGAFKTIPYEMARRIMSFEYDESEDMDKLTVKIWNKDLALTTDQNREDFLPYFELGVLWKVRYGYEGVLSSEKYVRIQHMSGFEEIKVEAYESVLSFAQKLYTRVWDSEHLNVLDDIGSKNEAITKMISRKEGQPNYLPHKQRDGKNNGIFLKELVGSIAAKYNYTIIEELHVYPVGHTNADGIDIKNTRFSVEEMLIELPDKTTVPYLTTYVQPQANDMCFLQSLANDLGFRFWIETLSVSHKGNNAELHYEGIFHFRQRMYWQKPHMDYYYFNQYANNTSVEGYEQTGIMNQILSFDNPSLDTRGKKSYFMATDVNLFTGEKYTAKSSVKEIDGRYAINKNDGMKHTFLGDKFFDFYSIQKGFDEGAFKTVVDFKGAKVQADYISGLFGKTLDELKRNREERYDVFIKKELAKLTKEKRNKIAEELRQAKENMKLARELYPLMEATYKKQIKAAEAYSRKTNRIVEVAKGVRAKNPKFRIGGEDYNIKTVPGLKHVTAENYMLIQKLRGNMLQDLENTVSSSMKIIGNPYFSSKRLYELHGLGIWSSKWYVKNVIHYITNGNYTCKANMISNSNMKNIRGTRPADIARMNKEIPDYTNILKKLQQIADIGGVAKDLVKDYKKAVKKLNKQTEELIKKTAAAEYRKDRKVPLPSDRTVSKKNPSTTKPNKNNTPHSSTKVKKTKTEERADAQAKSLTDMAYFRRHETFKTTSVLSLNIFTSFGIEILIALGYCATITKANKPMKFKSYDGIVYADYDKNGDPAANMICKKNPIVYRYKCGSQWNDWQTILYNNYVNTRLAERDQYRFLDYYGIGFGRYSHIRKKYKRGQKPTWAGQWDRLSNNVEKTTKKMIHAFYRNVHTDEYDDCLRDIPMKVTLKNQCAVDAVNFIFFKELSKIEGKKGEARKTKIPAKTKEKHLMNFYQGGLDKYDGGKNLKKRKVN